MEVTIHSTSLPIALFVSTLKVEGEVEGIEESQIASTKYVTSIIAKVLGELQVFFIIILCKLPKKFGISSNIS